MKTTLRREMDGRILRLAVPNIISNITVPLLTIVDVALAGHMESAGSIGAVAVAAGVVNYAFWLFAFLRMGTTGFTAQAFGRSDVRAITRYLARGVLLALGAGLLLIVAAPLVERFGHLLASGQETIGREAREYIRIALWGAPAALLIYVFNGWYVGMQNTRIPMWVAILSNLINIVLSFYFVKGLDMGVVGLATGTVVAQYIGLALLVGVAMFRYRRVLRFFRLGSLSDTSGYGVYLRTGGDLFVRTAMLGAVTLFFTSASSAIGETTVAANALLMQLFTLFSYFMDGFAYAGEALTGRYIGARRADDLRLMIRRLFFIGTIVSLVVTILYLLFPVALLSLLSDKQAVVSHASRYAVWAGIVPLVSFAAFLWDGVFVGATASAAMRTAMTAAFVVFFAVYYAFRLPMGEAALWLAFNLYLLTRSLMQTLWYRRRFYSWAATGAGH
ncbi:MATE family efflux transporter [Porphyromonas loveana]|uniref:MATE family efflux transporter n=1 Tax=Porphyromonas loveana TaxID=1884669 RepID=UPI0035A0D79B